MDSLVSVVRRSSFVVVRRRARILRRRKKRSQTVVRLQTRIRGFGCPASRGSGRGGGTPVPPDGGCGRLTERYPSRGRRASTAFAREPVVSSARPARRDAGATKTRHRRRRRFSRRDGPASRARRERERATYLDGAERRGGGKGEGGHLRGLYVNGAFVCAAHRRRRASQHAFETRTFVRFAFPRASSSIDRRATTRDRRSNPRVKKVGVFRPMREKPTTGCQLSTRESRLQQRTHNAFV